MPSGERPGPRGNLLKDSATQYLLILQGVIQRMASNSFMVKGWSVSLVALLIALQAGGPRGVSVALLPALAFWGLDAYYLRQERLFRALYNDVVKRLAEGRPYVCFSMDTGLYEREVDSWARTLFRWPVASIHVAVVASAIVFGCLR